MEGDALHEPLALAEWILGAPPRELVNQDGHASRVRLNYSEVVAACVPHHLTHVLKTKQK